MSESARGFTYMVTKDLERMLFRPRGEIARACFGEFRARSNGSLPEQLFVIDTVAPLYWRAVGQLARDLFGRAVPMKEVQRHEFLQAFTMNLSPIPKTHRAFGISKIISGAYIAGLREAYARYHMEEEQATQLAVLMAFGPIDGHRNQSVYLDRAQSIYEKIVLPLRTDPAAPIDSQPLPINLPELPLYDCDMHLGTHSQGNFCQKGAELWSARVSDLLFADS